MMKTEKQLKEKLLKKIGYYDYKKLPKKKRYKVDFPDLKTEENYPLSNAFMNSGFKKSIDDYKWKKDKNESIETIKEIEKKKERIAPAYSKGAYQYITNETNLTDIGRKK